METGNKFTSEVIDTNVKRRGTIFFCLALCCFAAAYLMLSLVPINSSPIGFFVLSAVLYAVTIAACLMLKGRLGIWSFVFMILGLVLAFYGIFHEGSRYNLTGSNFLIDLFPVFFLSGICYSLFTLSLFGNNSGSLGGGFLLDMAKSAAYLFILFPSFFKCLFKPEGSKRSGRTFLFIIVGLIAAMVLVLIVGGLLSFDKHFTDMLPKLDFEIVVQTVLKLFFAVPLSAMLFSLFASSFGKKLPELSSSSSSDKVGKAVKVIPAPVIMIPVIAVLAVYVMFFISQWAYYMSAFTHELPDGYSAAEYAREGFFQLCAVAAVNAVLIAVLSCFIKRTGKAGEIVEKSLRIFLSVASLILIATAISKMVLYIDMYDLTRIRLIVTLFLVFLAAAFIFTILSALIKRFKAIPAIVVTGAVMLAAFSLVNVNGLIAKYNVDMYLNGKHENIDVEYIQDDLGFSAVPELKRLYENANDAAVKKEAHDALKQAKHDLYELELKWYEKSIPVFKAEKILEDWK